MSFVGDLTGCQQQNLNYNLHRQKEKLKQTRPVAMRGHGAAKESAG